MDNPTDEAQEPWVQLEQLLETESLSEASEYLDSLPADETARAISRLEEEAQTRLLAGIAPEDAAKVLDAMSDAQAADLVERLEPEDAATIVQQLPSNERADLIGDLPAADADAILTELPPEDAAALRELSEYPDNVAGGLMVTEVLAYESRQTAAQVIDDMRANVERYRDYDVQYAFVTDQKRQLVGVLRLRDLLLARPARTLDTLMIRDPVSIRDTDDLDELREFFDEHRFLGVPVVTGDGTLVGLVRRVDVEEALAERLEDDYRKTQGIVQEELRSMPLLLRSRRRLSWLSVNILLNVVAASVIAFYQDTLAQIIALAVFLPIISDMSGCSGNQAVAVSMRELSLGLLRPTEFLRVLGKEVSLGIINGMTLGGLLAVVAWLWKGNPYLGLVIGVAMALNTTIAVAIGGCLPLVLKRMNMDPALGSGPVLTTVTDMCGFFILLSLASALLPQLI